MTNQELIKQAYAYGAAVALQELGLDNARAQEGGLKLAEEASGGHPLLGGALGAGAGGLGLAALGAGSAFVPKLKGLGLSKLLAKSKGTAKMFGAGQRAGVPLSLIENTAFRGMKNPAAAAKGTKQWAEGISTGPLSSAANTVQESYLRGLGGAGLGVLGGGAAGGMLAS
jgi:hypothetical protein